MTPMGFNPGPRGAERTQITAPLDAGRDENPNTHTDKGESILGAQTGARETGNIERLIAEVSAHALRNAADAWGEDGLEWLYLQGADDDVANVLAVTKWLNERANQIEKGQL